MKVLQYVLTILISLAPTIVYCAEAAPRTAPLRTQDLRILTQKLLGNQPTKSSFVHGFKTADLERWTDFINRTSTALRTYQPLGITRKNSQLFAHLSEQITLLTQQVATLITNLHNLGIGSVEITQIDPAALDRTLITARDTRRQTRILAEPIHATWVDFATTRDLKLLAQATLNSIHQISQKISRDIKQLKPLVLLERQKAAAFTPQPSATPA